MTNMIETYKCPSCGSDVVFDPANGRYSCGHCGSFFELDDLRPKASQSLHNFACTECGAELVGSEEVASFSCPFCGSKLVARSKFEDRFAPDFIIPFQLTRKDAIERIRKTTRERDVLVDGFIDNAEVISTEGVYVPFWLFNGEVLFKYDEKVDEHMESSAWDYFGVPHVDYHPEPMTTFFTHRYGSYELVGLPADASVRMPDDLMDSLQPYRYDGLEPFTTACMPGFVAERYTEPPAISWARTRFLMERATMRLTRNKGRILDVRLVLPDMEEKVQQALLPVWLLVLERKGTRYLVGINGQTGKMASSLPIDEKKLHQRAFEEVDAKGGGNPKLARIALAVLICLSVVFLVFSVFIGSIGTNAMIVFLMVFLPALGIPAVLLSGYWGESKEKYEAARVAVVEGLDNVSELTEIERFVREQPVNSKKKNTDDNALENRSAYDPRLAAPAGIPTGGNGEDGIGEVFASNSALTWGQLCDIVREHIDTDRPFEVYANDEYPDLFSDAFHPLWLHSENDMLCLALASRVEGRKFRQIRPTGEKLLSDLELFGANGEARIKFVLSCENIETEDNADESVIKAEYMLSNINRIEACQSRNALHFVGKVELSRR